MLISLFHNFCFGQKQIQEKTEFAFGLSNQDSVVRFNKSTIFDKEGRVISKDYYYYHPNEKGLLIKEEKVYFNTQTQTLKEELISYQIGKEPLSQKLVTKYLLYHPKEAESKRTGRQLYDNYGEITKEDTLTYNAEGLLIEHCEFDYRGNTSLFCHYHTYNKNGSPTRWVTYSKWTTINGKGEVADRQTKRRDYRYRYNKNNQLVASGGKHYSNRYRQKIRYDKAGHILEDNTYLRRKTRLAAPKEKPKQKKFRIDKEVHTLQYTNGLLTTETKLLNKKETLKKEYTYQDSLPLSIKTHINGILTESIEFQYDNNYKLLKKTDNKYTKEGKLRYAIATFYNTVEKPIKEVQSMGNKILSVLELEYDEEGNPTMQSLSTNNNKNFEKTLYIYKYY